MSQKMGYLVDLSTVNLSDDDTPSSWIQAMPLGKYQHPFYGEIDITSARVKRFADNVNNGVRGTELDIDYDHKATGGEAAGWVKKAEARSDGLWIFVEWTKSAAQKIKEKAYKYFSPEFNDTWKHPKTSETFKDVLFGGGITNRPFLKDILPLNLSEAFEEATDPTHKGVNMSDALKAIRTKLGLPEDATDEQVLEALDKKQAESSSTEDENENEKVPVGASLSDVEALKKLAETNSAIKALMDTVEAQGQQLAVNNKQLREAQAAASVQKLNEVAGKKGFAFPPVVTDQLQKFFSDSDIVKVADVEKMLISLAEVGLVDMVTHGKERQSTEPDPVKAFNDAVTKHVEEHKVSRTDAIVELAAQNPQLFADYRAASYAGHDN